MVVTAQWHLLMLINMCYCLLTFVTLASDCTLCKFTMDFSLKLGIKLSVKSGGIQCPLHFLQSNDRVVHTEVHVKNMFFFQRCRILNFLVLCQWKAWGHSRDCPLVHRYFLVLLLAEVGFEPTYANRSQSKMWRKLKSVIFFAKPLDLLVPRMNDLCLDVSRIGAEIGQDAEQVPFQNIKNFSAMKWEISANPFPTRKSARDFFPGGNIKLFLQCDTIP